MKVEILKENIKTGLSVAERIVGKNISLPIINNVLISTEDSFLSLVSTDLETAIKLWILTKVIKKGKALVSVKFLSSFITSLPNEKITIEERGQNLYIECQNLKTQIQGYNPEEFPIIPEFKSTEYLEVDVAKLCQGLSQVIDIPVLSSSRPEISGIYFFFSENNIKVVATDSFRLGEKNIPLENAVKKECSFILPQKPAREIMNILDGKDGLLKIYFSNNQVLFEAPFKEVAHPQENFTKPNLVQNTNPILLGQFPKGDAPHSILYYIDKDKPLVTIPQNSSTDLMLPFFEEAIKNWLLNPNPTSTENNSG